MARLLFCEVLSGKTIPMIRFCVASLFYEVLCGKTIIL